MTKKRKIHTPEFKTKVAVAAIKALKTSSELASQYQIHPVQISGRRNRKRTWPTCAHRSLVPE